MAEASIARKKKKTPPWLKNKLLVAILQTRPAILLSNWFLQCMLYAEPIEVLFRLTLEFGVFLLLIGLMSTLTPLSTLVLVSVALITHTVLFIVNGQLFVLWRFIGNVRTDPGTFIGYAEGLGKRLEKRGSIRSALLFGSLTRDRFSESSDLDVRVVSKSNVQAGFVASFWVFLERFRALLHKYPLDIYVVNELGGLEKLRTDEPPVVLFDKDGFVRTKYSDYEDYSVYRWKFLQKFVLGSKKEEGATGVKLS